MQLKKKRRKKKAVNKYIYIYIYIYIYKCIKCCVLQRIKRIQSFIFVLLYSYKCNIITIININEEKKEWEKENKNVVVVHTIFNFIFARGLYFSWIKCKLSGIGIINWRLSLVLVYTMYINILHYFLNKWLYTLFSWINNNFLNRTTTTTTTSSSIIY